MILDVLDPGSWIHFAPQTANLWLVAHASVVSIMPHAVFTVMPHIVIVACMKCT